MKKQIMSRLNKLGLYSLLLGVALSCNNENYSDDFNKDQYAIYSANYKSLLAGAIMNFGQNGGDGSNAYQMMPILFSQYQSQVVYTTEQTYGDTPGAWARYYVNQINNLNEIISGYSNNPSPEILLQGSAENMIGVSKIFRAIIMKRLTDTYGDAPFSEAAKATSDIFLPKYDSQKAVYEAIIADLKSGRDLLNTSSTSPAGDILFYGNLNKWKKLANSVLLQATLQLSKKYPAATGYAATEFKDALSNSAGVIETVADEAWFTIAPGNSYPNPFSDFRSADYRISRELVESMKGSGNTFNRTSNHTPDTRLTLYANTGKMSAVGLPYGYNSNDLAAAGYSTSGVTTISVKFRSSSSAISLMTAGYTYLNRAEAAAKGWTGEAVSDMLTNGIVLNYNTLDDHYVLNTNAYNPSTNPFGGTKITPGAAAYAGARVADIALFGAERVIGEEKWIALFLNGFDAWAEFRRTGFPALLPAPSAVNGGVIPRRLRYPVEEANFNNANYLKGVQGLLPAEDKNTSKVWWDQ
ncbi:SusD/RagB family nutrient-binding outer membrane lipoprotein [Chryseobacterium fluminis]|uniref:SusD/RagB family nutrient-binding outer membrane lipoprotein n=1 Tax=Chryseobacterium fluminis TaxID=2983606 RepID=UPI0022501D5A|nr:SusD/RagB family nutrient-binding outer membrane lipoprotein [Chryseobacterium sp. MMS21-Ot14]UZU00065.1 SusD/RagB family nutrient-binding outer membrane lipoprotein [Chryseobacterium sp. MMS21-Ot14]